MHKSWKLRTHQDWSRDLWVEASANASRQESNVNGGHTRSRTAGKRCNPFWRVKERSNTPAEVPFQDEVKHAGSPFKPAPEQAVVEHVGSPFKPAPEQAIVEHAGSPFKPATEQQALQPEDASPFKRVLPIAQEQKAFTPGEENSPDDRRRPVSKQTNLLPGSPAIARNSLVPSLDDDFYTQYSLDDMRRLAKKLMDLGILESHQIAAYVQDEVPDQETPNEVLCTYDAKIQWTTYNVKNQDFTFPHFMKNPVYLSRGGFGTVVKCLRYGKEPVAIKKVDVPDKLNSEMALRLLRELVIMKQAKKVNQRHICKIIDIFGDPRVKHPEDLRHIFIVMPLYKPGSLDCVRIQDAPTFKTIAGHTLSALHFLHLHKIMHRDIKKENIFFDAARNRAYLADLGQARTWNAHRMSGNGQVGTRCYVSPEILQGHHYDFRSDVYSLGQTWFEVACMMSGHEPLFPYGKSGGNEHVRMQYALDPAVHARRGFSSMEPYAQWAAERWQALSVIVVDQWKDPSVVRILERMLQFDPTRRADTKKLFSLPYFFPFVTEDKVIDLGEVDTHDYAEIKQRIFDLQHGSCSKATCDHESENSPESRKSRYSKMCSKAVQYFVEDKEVLDEHDGGEWWLRK